MNEGETKIVKITIEKKYPWYKATKIVGEQLKTHLSFDEDEFVKLIKFDKSQPYHIELEYRITKKEKGRLFRSRSVPSYPFMEKGGEEP
jgi:hypothetical protein